MQISLETISPTARSIKLMLDKKIVEQHFHKRLKEIASEVKLDGFRPGKVPLSVIKQKYGSLAKSEAIEIIINKNLSNFILENKIPIVNGSAIFKPNTKEETEQELSFLVKFEVFPEFTLNEFSNLKPTKMVVDVNEKDVDNAITIVREVHGNNIALDGAASDNDVATIDWSMHDENDEVIDNEEDKVVKLDKEQNEIISQIKPYIIGMKLDEEKSIVHTFLEDFKIESLAGKQVTINIKLLKLETIELAELNSEFIKKIGVKSGDLEDLKKEIKANLVHHAKNITDSKFKQEVLDCLYEDNKDKIEEMPKHLLKLEMDRMKENLVSKFPNLFKDTASITGLDEHFKSNALSSLTRYLLIQEVVDKYDMKYDEAKLNAFIQSKFQFTENPQQEIKKFLSDKANYDGLMHSFTQDLAIEVIAKEADVQEKIYSYQEVLAFTS